MKRKIHAVAKRSHIGYAFAALLSALLLTCTSTASAAGPTGVGAIPANPREDNPRSKSIFVYDANLGETISDEILVTNNTDKDRRIALYAVDSQASSDGAFACAQAVDERKDVGSWTQVSTENVSLKASQKQKVKFTIDIPNQTSPGEHNGCIVVQDLTSAVSNANSGVVLNFRSAVRVAITIPGDIVTDLSLKEVQQAQTSSGKITVSPVYKSNGNVSLDTTIGVKFAAVFGNTVDEAGGTFPVLAQTEAKFNFEIAEPKWGGFYRRVIVTEYSPLNQSGDKDKLMKLPDSASWVFIMPKTPQLLIELAVVILFALLATAIIRRKKQNQHLHKHTKQYTVHEGEDLQSVAAKHRVSWKQLAKINHLKPPYALSAGQKVKVPANKP